MLEFSTTRQTPLVDPHLGVWSWEIPVYLFLGGVVAGLMVMGGLALLRIARGEDGRRFFSAQAPLLGFVLMNVGMLALLLDLTHRLYVWRVYTTFQPASPMSWGSWVLLLVYAVLLVSALVRLPEAWPWLSARVPRLRQWSEALAAAPRRLAVLGWSNVLLGVSLGVYTGILLNTLVARPLWNSSILAPLFLVSGLSTGAAVLHLLEALRAHPERRPQGWRRVLPDLLQRVGLEPPAHEASVSLVRWDQVFIAVEAALIALFLVDLSTGSASHAGAASLLLGGRFAWAFWGVVVAAGLLVPFAWQALALSRRVPHSALPAILVLVGGFTLRWVLVNAGQVSAVVPVAFSGR